MSKKKQDKAPKKRIAKRDFIIHRNDHHFEIKKGDDLDELGVPNLYNTNLKTERVL